MPPLKAEEGNYGDLASQFLMLVALSGDQNTMDSQIDRMAGSMAFGAYEASAAFLDLAPEEVIEAAHSSHREGEAWLNVSDASASMLDVAIKIPLYIMSMAQHGQSELAAVKHALKIVTEERRAAGLPCSRTTLFVGWGDLKPISPMLAAMKLCADNFVEVMDAMAMERPVLPATYKREALADPKFWEAATAFSPKFSEAVEGPMLEIVHAAREVQKFGEKHFSNGQLVPLYTPDEVWRFPDWVPKSYKPLEIDRLTEQQLDWAAKKNSRKR